MDSLSDLALVSQFRAIRFLPFKLAKERLDPSALKASETNLMPEKTLQEFLKSKYICPRPLAVAENSGLVGKLLRAKSMSGVSRSNSFGAYFPPKGVAAAAVSGH